MADGYFQNAEAPREQLVYYKVPESYAGPPVKYYRGLGEGRTLAYRKFSGSAKNAPQILYVPGFFAGMDLPKTVVVEQYARHNGFTNVRYDPEGVGKSSIDVNKVQVEHWLEDAVAMVDHVCDPDVPVILVSSSVGSWLSAHVAMMRPNRIAGVIMCGPAFNAVRPGYWFNYNLQTEEVRKMVDENRGHIMVKVKYGGQLPLRRDFAENSAKLEFDLNQPLDIKCPVRILHSTKDFDIPYENSLQLLDSIATSNVDLVLRKTGNHRLMTEKDCMLTLNVLDLLITEVFPDAQRLNQSRTGGSWIEFQPPTLMMARSKI